MPEHDQLVVSSLLLQVMFQVHALHSRRQGSGSGSPLTEQFKNSEHSTSVTRLQIKKRNSYSLLGDATLVREHKGRLIRNEGTQLLHNAIIGRKEHIVAFGGRARITGRNEQFRGAQSANPARILSSALQPTLVAAFGTQNGRTNALKCHVRSPNGERLQQKIAELRRVQEVWEWRHEPQC